MFKPTPMQRVTLQVLTDDAPAAALALAECGVFNPQATQEFADDLPEVPGERYRELYRGAQSRLEKVLSHCALTDREMVPVTVRYVPEAELADLDDWLQHVWAKCSECQEGMRRVEEGQKQIDQLIATLDKFASLDIDLGLLQRKKHFLDIRIGTLPADNVPRLKESVAIADYVLESFMVSDGTAQVIIAGPTGREHEIDAAIQAAGWHTLQIPPEFQDRPEKVRADLIARRERIVEDVQTQCNLIEMARKEFRDRLLAAHHTLAMAAPFAEVGGAMYGRGGLSVLTGWVPKRAIDRLRGNLQERLGNTHVLTTRDPLPEERPLVPSVMRSHWLIQPFVSLVKNYGVPRYGEIDPTALFAVSFVAMFGMMFGDVGHGASIAVFGLLLRRTLKQFTVFVVAVGLSSTLFGALYGSIFGYEHLFHPLWMSPLSDPMRMLTLALYWGIGFILIATALTIRNRLVDGRVLEALFDGKGLAGMLFYLGLLFGAWRWVAQSRFGLLETALIVVPLGAILAYKWHENRIPFGEKVLVVLIEGFETVMAYVANTLSFLRVAAFSLNHVALSIAVFTLAGMMGQTGHWITVVLGNVFILVLEGAIVAIQVLRLEYYEGFSRFFSGDGREFRPLRLRTSQAG